MYKYYCLLFVYTILANYSFCQLKIKVTSKNNNISLPYATITNKTSKQVYSSDENGEANILVINSNVIEISYIGFYATQFIYDGKKNIEVALLEDSTILDVVTVKNCKKDSKVLKNYKKQKGYLEGFNGYAWSEANSDKNAYGILLRLAQEQTYLSKFSFWIEQDIFGSDSSIYAPFLVSFFDVNEYDLPSKSLLQMPIIFKPKMAGKQTLILDSINIQIPTNGIYVVLQYVKDDKYLWKTRLRDVCKSCPDTEKNGYGAILKGVANTGYTSVFFNQITNDWSKANRSEAIKFEAELYFCK